MTQQTLTLDVILKYTRHSIAYSVSIKLCNASFQWKESGILSMNTQIPVGIKIYALRDYEAICMHFSGAMKLSLNLHMNESLCSKMLKL